MTVRLAYKDILREYLHPTQFAILELMRANPDLSFTPKGLAETLQQPLPNVSYHVRRLSTAKLIRCVKTTPARGAVRHHYKLSGAVRAGRNGK
jgi:DNA-binding MarR family transcriptional regulator